MSSAEYQRQYRAKKRAESEARAAALLLQIDARSLRQDAEAEFDAWRAAEKTVAAMRLAAEEAATAEHAARARLREKKPDAWASFEARRKKNPEAWARAALDLERASRTPSEDEAKAG